MQYSGAGRRSASRSKNGSARASKGAASPLSMTVEDDMDSPLKRRKRKRELFPESPSDGSSMQPRHKRKTHTTAASSTGSAMDVLSAAAATRTIPVVSTHGLDTLLAAMEGGSPEQGSGSASKLPKPNVPRGAAGNWAASQHGLLDLAADKLGATVALHHMLSTRRARRWTMYEWFYSSIDVLYFKQNEFQMLLNDLGLFRVNRLTRTEWSYIRSKMGKPRRLSRAYLKQELKKLAVYREEVRAHHSGKAGPGTSSQLEMELYLDEIPAPINVGTPVVAHHPKDGELYAGKVLLKDGHRYRIQFDDQMLGQPLLINDTHVMPQPGMHANRWRRRTPREPDVSQSYSKDSAELMERKKAVVLELRAVLEHINKMTASGEAITEEIELKRDTLQQDLTDIEDHLKSLHEQVAQMQVHMPSMQLTPNLLAEQCLAAAEQLTKDAWASHIGEIPESTSQAEVERMQELLSGCLSVLFALHDTGRRPPVDVQQVLHHVLQRVRPLSGLSAPEFHNIEATLKVIRDCCIATSI